MIAVALGGDHFKFGKDICHIKIDGVVHKFNSMRCVIGYKNAVRDDVNIY